MLIPLVSKEHLFALLLRIPVYIFPFLHLMALSLEENMETHFHVVISFESNKLSLRLTQNNRTIQRPLLRHRPSAYDHKRTNPAKGTWTEADYSSCLIDGRLFSHYYAR